MLRKGDKGQEVKRLQSNLNIQLKRQLIIAIINYYE